MEGLRLLEKARAAGLTVTVDCNQLVIRGPKRAVAVARELLDNKAEVMATLSPAVAIDTTDDHQQPTESNPAKVTVNGNTYDVALTAGMWFFRLVPEAGWTCCSKEFCEIIDEQLGRSVAARSGKSAGRSSKKPTTTST